MGKLRDYMSAKEIEMFEAFKGHKILDLEVQDSISELMLAAGYVGLCSAIETAPHLVPKEGLKYIQSLGRAIDYHDANIGNCDKATLDSLIYPE